MRRGRAMMWGGGAAGIFALVCCATPILPVALGAVGAGALAEALWRDAVLLPVAAFMFCMAYVGYRASRRAA